jgi:hypothetical protein
MRRATLACASVIGLFACGGGETPPPQTAPAASAQLPPPPTPQPEVAPAAAAPAPPPSADPPPIPPEKLQAYVAIWREYFAKENGITPEELDKRVKVTKTESATRDYSRTFLEVKLDVTSGWASVHGASSELLTRIKPRASDPPPGVRFDTWLEPNDYAAMKNGKALLTTRYNFGALRFPKQADAEKAVPGACKNKKRMHEFQVAIAGDGDPWLVSLFQTGEGKELWPCGVDLVKNKGGELMNFDAGDSAFK